MELQTQSNEKDKLRERRRVHLDDVFTEFIGEGGRYQIFLVFLLAFNAFCSAGVFIDILWVGDLKPHWCALPADTNPAVSNLSSEEKFNLTIPWIEVNGQKQRDSCHMYNWNYSTLDPHQSVQNASTTKCIEWEFDKSDFNNTIVEKWEMVCSRRLLVATSQSVVLAANPAGAIIGGILTDKYGRRPMTLILSITPIVIRIVQIFAPTLSIYLVCTFLVSACYMATYISTFALGVEIVGPRYRYVIGLLGPVLWAVGAIASTGVAYFIRDRVTLQLVLTIPLLFFLCYIYFIPESPRWLISKGRITESNNILHKFARSNDRFYPEEEVDITLEDQKKFKILDVLTSKTIMFRTFIVALGWWSVVFVYTGLSMNVTNISGDLYLNMFILYLVELPGCFIAMWLVDTWLGRRLTVGGLLFISGVSLLLVSAVPPEQELVILVLVTISKSVISGGFAGVYVITAEIYSPETRTAAISFLNSSGKVLGILTPFIAHLAIYKQYLPLLIFGILPTVSGPMMLLLPETKGQPLPQTLQEVKNMKSGLHCRKGSVNAQ